MFEAGKKYVFSRSAFWSDMLSMNIKVIPWWINALEGRVFVGLGATIHKLEVDGCQVHILPEWCSSGEVDDLI